MIGILIGLLGLVLGCAITYLWADARSYNAGWQDGLAQPRSITPPGHYVVNYSGPGMTPAVAEDMRRAAARFGGQGSA